jgi:hypothetical protein
MTPSRNSAPPQRWTGLVSASLDTFRGDVDVSNTEEIVESTGEGTVVDDLISKAAVAVEAHVVTAQVARSRMAKLSAEAAASLRAAIEGEAPAPPGAPSRGVTSGTRLDVQS